MLLLLTAVSAQCLATTDTVVERAELKGSKIMIAKPVPWNGNALILAHGLRTENLPLTADFSMDDPFARTLLDEGWLIASTSYRRNGLIIDEAVDDIRQLVDHVAEKHGKPSRVFVEGGSMGGSIALLIADNPPVGWAGALCIGPALFDSLKFTHKPRVPVVFLCNQNEVTAPREYMAKLADGAVKPALWIVKRDGHCNVNDTERLNAFRALVAYAQKEPVELSKDATVDTATSVSVAVFRDGGAAAKVLAVSPAYGNFNTQFIAGDLDRLGIKKGDRFVVQFGDRKYEVLLGTTYGDVAQGEWVAFFTAEGQLKIARQFASAVELLGCTVGDEILVKPKVARARPTLPDSLGHSEHRLRACPASANILASFP